VFYASGFILALAAAGVPRRIAHFRAMSDGKPSTFGRRIEQTILRRLLDASATDVVGCAEGVLDAVWQSRWRQDPRCQVIYNGIDPDRFRVTVDRDDLRDELGLPRDALVFVHVGYDAEEKNHPRLLKIFAEIRRRAPGARLVLAGDGTDCPGRVVFRHIREFALQDSVDALGVRRDIPRLLAAADVLLLPSLAEGLPGVVLEACAAGVPVLATDLPGVREIAARLPAVYYLSLAQDDREWARTALSLPGEARALRLRETAAAVFRHSVFDVDRAVVAHRALWCRRSSTVASGELPA
jgi:glycosyltransferase involved in cell wall biosynthesis